MSVNFMITAVLKGHDISDLSTIQRKIPPELLEDSNNSYGSQKKPVNTSEGI